MWCLIRRRLGRVLAIAYARGTVGENNQNSVSGGQVAVPIPASRTLTAPYGAHDIEDYAVESTMRCGGGRRE